jgi:HSP20 family protein
MGDVMTTTLFGGIEMALVRWEPRLFGTVFDSPAGGNGLAVRRRWVPAIDLVEEGDRYVLRADLPGVGEDDVKIEFEGNVLTVSGERSSQREERRDGYYRVERASGRFSRSLVFPEGVDPDGIHASFDAGVLEVTVPKPEQRKPHRVAIEVGRKADAVEGADTAAA